MGNGRRRTHRFLCFTIPAGAVADDDEISSSGELSRRRRRRRRWILPRIISRLLKSGPSMDASGKLIENSTRSQSSKVSEDKFVPESSIEEDDRGSEPIFTSSASSSSTSSSASSLLSSASTPSFPAPATSPEVASGRRRISIVKRKYDSPTGLCVLVVSLCVLVFCGRLGAILLTSTWLCLNPRRNIPARLPEYAEAAREGRQRGCGEREKRRVVLEGLLERNRKY